MKRVVIIGSSGAGKTTLAKQLSQRLDIPHNELDSMYHQANWQPTDMETFKKNVLQKADEDEWILCGNYFTAVGTELWQKADTVIWCDYSFPRVFYRIVRRTLQRTVTREELWNGNRERFYTNFFTKDSIIVWMITSWNKQKRRYTLLFNTPGTFQSTKLIRLKTPKATANFLRSLQ